VSREVEQILLCQGLDVARGSPLLIDVERCPGSTFSWAELWI